MAKNKVSEWSATPANNTDIGGIDIAEGCSPAGINNAIRELMSQVKDMQAGTDSDNFTVGGNLSVTGTADFVGGLATDLPIADGGTGASTASDARTNLGLGTMATQNATAVAITGGSITGITDLLVADGGTGVSALTANNVILGNGTDPVQFVAPGTSGNVLTSNGTTWASSAPTASGLTLLATITTTSGSSQTSSTISLTGYKQVQFIFNKVSASSSSADVRILDGSTNLVVATTSTTASNFLVGFMQLDLGTGVFTCFTQRGSSATPSSNAINPDNIVGGITTFSTSTTAFTFNVSSGSFDAGSILVYGVK